MHITNKESELAVEISQSHTGASKTCAKLRSTPHPGCQSQITVQMFRLGFPTKNVS